jgi:ubiquitin carboxyl-terminal hydrolase 15
VQHEGKTRWYDFDDRHVGPIGEDNIKTSAAYVLFYKRIQNDSLDTDIETDSKMRSNGEF